MESKLSRVLLIVAFLSLLSATAGRAATRARFPGEAILKDAGARISAGGGFACQVKEDGKVRCWGLNNVGQLGNGSTTNSPNPVLVSGIANAVAVSAGLGHACALLADGTVRCWGNNTDGELGDGTALNARLTPVAVSGLSGAVAITAGAYHTCALLSSGFVRCWGFNGVGELGNGNEIDQHVPAATQLSNAVGIAAGSYHTCAVLADGTASCWGDDFEGQLGIGSNGGFGAEVRTPVAVKNVRSAVAISAQGAATCVLLASATAQCWGENSDGQSGTGGTSKMHSTPVLVVGLNNAVSIDVGGEHVCASLANGTARCWGKNDFGQAGDGTVGGVRPSPVAVRGLSIAVAITASVGFSCALLVEGSASCWGANDIGELGGGSAAASSPFPVTVTGGGGSITARAIAAGRDHTCALRANSTVSCWGSNDSGQIGDGTIGGNRLSPTAVPGLSGVIALAAGDAHTCALLVAGTVRCWGLNTTGQLGDGSTNSSPTPITVVDLDNIIAIAAGGGLGSSHTCALQARGGVFCWGADGSGQVGNGTTATSVTRPTRTSSLGTSVPAAVSVAAGAFHTCVLLVDGTATCWGFNSSGQLGDNSFATHVSPVFVNMTNVVALAAGDFHTCALVAVGADFCWGANGNGQLGTNGGASNKPFPILISLDQDAVAAAAGFGHTCVLVSSGGARCWGDNSSGQLGIASTVTSTAIPSVVRRLVGNITVVTQLLANAVTIAAGRRHTCAVIASGFVMCWGDNTSGQLGFGSTTPVYNQPNAVPSFALNIDPTVTFKHENNDRQTIVTVIANCEAGLRLSVNVTLTQGQASGRGSDQLECTGGIERYPVKVHTLGRDTFDEGAARVSAEGLIKDGGLVVDVQDWTRAVNIVGIPDL